MTEIIHIEDIKDARISVYASLTERQLLNRKNPEQGLFIAESPKVIAVALKAGYKPVSFLCEQKHIAGDAAQLIEHADGTPVFTGTAETLEQLTGYKMSRGVLCAMKRPDLPSLEHVCEGARRIVIIDSVVDNTNIGVIFRSAAALGIDAVVLTRTSCDPLNRRSVRVSMGSVFLVPWTWAESAQDVKQFGFKTMAMALTDKSIPLDDEQLKKEPKLAIIMGNEGDGLDGATITSADYTVRIPMHHTVDSLNVGAAAAIAFWELRVK